MTITFPDDVEVSGDVPDDMDVVQWKSLPGGETTSPLTGVIGHDDTDGTITALVAVSGVVDEVGDVIVPGSLDKAVKRLKPKGVMSHNWSDKVSKLVWFKELMPGDPMLPTQTPDGAPWPAQAGGLLIKAKYNLDKESGRDAYADAKFYGPEECFSIGYKVRPGGARMRSGKRYLHDYDLYEWSQVLHGAHRLAHLTGVKSLSGADGGSWYADPRSGDTEGDTTVPDGVEIKVRVVRDADFWHLPVGTPIKGGMVPPGLNRPVTEQELHATTAASGDASGLHGAPAAPVKAPAGRVAAAGGAGLPGGLGAPPMPDMALPIPGPKDGDVPTGDPDKAVAALRTRLGEIEDVNTPAARTASAALTPFMVPGAPLRASEDGQLVAVHVGDAWRIADTANGGVMQLPLPGTLPQANVDVVLHELSQVGIPWGDVAARRKRWENPAQLQADKALVQGIFARAGTAQTTTPAGMGGAGMAAAAPPLPGAPQAPNSAPPAPPVAAAVPAVPPMASAGVPAAPAAAPVRKFPRGSLKGHGVQPGDRIRVHGHPKGTLEGTVESGKTGHSLVHDDGTKTWIGGSGSRHQVEKLGKAADQPPKALPEDTGGTETPPVKPVTAAPETPPVKPVDAVPAPPEMADRADKLRDDALGITEGPDGDIEVNEDVAARQDRVEKLLKDGAAGLTEQSDTQLGETRKDLTDELALQDELKRRDAARKADAAARRGEAGASSVSATDTPAASEDTGPKLRPGVAGAAEDLGDALNAKPRDHDAVTAASNRFETMLRRHGDSAAFDDVRAAIGDNIHAAVASGRLKPGMLFTAAGALREQRRVARNESAKKRRLAKRLDRDRIKALIGSVDTELRTRKTRRGAAEPKPSAAPVTSTAAPTTPTGPRADAEAAIRDGDRGALVAALREMGDTGPRETAMRLMSLSEDDAITELDDSAPKRQTANRADRHVAAQAAIAAGDSAAVTAALVGEHRKPKSEPAPAKPEPGAWERRQAAQAATSPTDAAQEQRDARERADAKRAEYFGQLANDALAAGKHDIALRHNQKAKYYQPDQKKWDRQHDAIVAARDEANPPPATTATPLPESSRARTNQLNAAAITAGGYGGAGSRRVKDGSVHHVWADPDKVAAVTEAVSGLGWAGMTVTDEGKSERLDVDRHLIEVRIPDKGAQSPQNGGGDDQRASDSSPGVVPEVPTTGVRQDRRQDGVLPETGGAGAGTDRPTDRRTGGTGSAGGDLPGETGAPDAGAARRDGEGDARVPTEPAAAELAGQRRTEPTDAGPVDAPGDQRRLDRSDGGVQSGAGGTGGPAADSGDAGTAETPDAGLTDQPEPDAAQLDAIPDTGESFHPSVGDLAPAGKKAKLEANLAALRTLRTIQAQRRPATPEEQAVLARWAGWGGLPEVFDDRKTDYASQREELRGLLSPAEWNEGRRNTLNAHYTDPRVVQSLWAAMGDLGFDGGRVLEPGSGSGTFIGFAPESADMVGVELDSTTAAISRALYPHATVRNESFADTRLPAGSFDATIGNVPFGQFALTDRVHNPGKKLSIHNHFIVKSLAQTKPGGLVTLLTSRYTLDSQDSAARKRMAEMGDLIGAVRLPTGSHSKTSGTDVIEDALIFRRREPGADPLTSQDWINSSKHDINGQQITVNDYFTAHPEQVLGEVTAEPGQYGTGSLIVRGDKDMAGLPDALARITETGKAAGATASPRMEGLAAFTESDTTRHEGHIAAHDDGSFTQAAQGAALPFEVPEKQAEELRGLIGMRDTLSALLSAESTSVSNSPEIRALRADLNTQYDAYVARYGPINRYTLTKTGARNAPGQGGFRRDPMSAIVRALEIYNPETGKAVKTDIFTKRSTTPREIPTHADTPEDALALSLDTYGEVNLPAIAGMLDCDETTARERLGTLIFEQPPLTDAEQSAAWTSHSEDQGALADQRISPEQVDLSTVGESVRTEGRLEPAAAYLSGNVRRKLAVAKAAAEHDARFKPNVAELEKVIPADLGVDEVDGRLGAAWIPADDVKAFMIDLLHGGESRYNPVQVATSGGGIWTVTGGDHGNAATEQWGTDRMSAGKIIAALLEQKPIKVTDTIDDKTYPNLEATLAAQAKADEISERFSEWLFEDSERTRRLLASYNNQFNAIKLRSYDGIDRVFPGMTSSGWKPRDHQVAAVNRIVSEPCALLAHVVGAGKTAEMAMGAAELKRLGMANKPAIVVPSHMLEQFTREYLQIYPNAKLLAAGTEDLKGDKRREFVARAATGQWDCVILTKDAMQLIPMSPEATQAYIDRELATMRAQLEAAQAEGGDSAQQATVKKMEKAVIKAEESLKAKLESTKDAGVSFEQTGIDYLFVDEAHQYSNLRTVTNIQGAGASGSGIATDLHMKIEHLRANNASGRVATFATGTPIRNTVTQAYVMQRFMRPDLLKEAGIHSFDQWAATFGQTVEEMELKPEGSGFRQTTRFAKFRNVPELLRLFQIFADVKTAEDLNLPTPKLEGGAPENVVVPSTPELQEMMAELAHRADQYRNGSPEMRPNAAGDGEVEDMMLLISMDGRKAAMQLSDKLDIAADKMAEIWQRTKNKPVPKDLDDPTAGDDPPPGGLQIVFCDMFTPKGGAKSDIEQRTEFDGGDFDAYETLRGKLADRGMDPKTIRFMHEAKNDRQKAELFAAARNGQVSVLIGSTEKMGVGTNVQRRAVALHHLDAPWRPSDLEQRDGRIMRQGNANDEISIHRYVTEGSFDAYMWQTLERKKKFIDQIMRGSLDAREIEDVGETALSYAEVKALATGNPMLMQKAAADTVVGKLSRLERTHNRTQTHLRNDVVTHRASAQASDKVAATLKAAIAKRTDTTTGDAFAFTVHGSTTKDRGEAVAMLKASIDDVIRNDYGYGDKAKPVAEFGGHKLMATVDRYYDRAGIRRMGVTLTWDGLAGGGLRGEGDKYVAAQLTHTQLDSIGPGILSTLAYSLKAFDTRRDIHTDRAENLRSEADKMEARIGVAFPHADALKAAREESERLKMAMESAGIREDAGPVESENAKALSAARSKAAAQVARVGRSAGREYALLKRFGNAAASPRAAVSADGNLAAMGTGLDMKVFSTYDGNDIRPEGLEGIVRDPQALLDDLAKMDLPWDQGLAGLRSRWNGGYSYEPPDYTKSYEEREKIRADKEAARKAKETAERDAIKAVWQRHLSAAPVDNTPPKTGIDAARERAARAVDNVNNTDAKKMLRRFAKASARIPTYSSDDGLIGVVTETDGSLTFFAVDNGMVLTDPYARGPFDDPAAVANDIAALGIPFGNGAARRERWSDHERYRADLAALKEIYARHQLTEEEKSMISAMDLLRAQRVGLEVKLRPAPDAAPAAPGEKLETFNEIVADGLRYTMDASGTLQRIEPCPECGADRMTPAYGDAARVPCPACGAMPSSMGTRTPVG